MKVLVCGGRDFTDEGMLFYRLDGQNRIAPITHIIHGGARGADSLAGRWARTRGIQEVRCDANWDVHGKRAGFLRNQAMADLLPDLVYTFPKNSEGNEIGTGTGMMVAIAKFRNIPLEQFFYEL